MDTQEILHGGFQLERKHIWLVETGRLPYNSRNGLDQSIRLFLIRCMHKSVLLFRQSADVSIHNKAENQQAELTIAIA